MATILEHMASEVWGELENLVSQIVCFQVRKKLRLFSREFMKIFYV